MGTDGGARRIAGSLLSLAVGVYVALQLVHLQSATPYLVDRDSYYHTRYANLLPQRGLSRSFPWTQYSFWKDRFADKELLYHVALVPFCSDESRMVRGGKVAAIFFAGLIFAAFGIALRLTGVRAAPIWAFVLFSAGNHFLFRLQEARPHALSILLFVVGVAFLLKGRWRWLAAVGFVYAWSYAAPHLLFGIAMTQALATAILEKRFEWRGLAAAGGGVLAGLLLNPYFPNNLHLWWVQNVVVLWRAWGIGGEAGYRLGEEFASVDLRSLIESSTAVYLALAAGVVLAILSARSQRLSARTFTLLFVTLATFTLYCFSAKFADYFPPSAVWFAASAASDLWDESWLKSRKAWIAGAALALLVVGLHAWSLGRTLSALRSYPEPALKGAAAWTRENVPKGSLVVHVSWGDFVELFHYDPEHRYINGLDPTFMYVTDAARMNYLEEIRIRRRHVVGRELAEMFGSDVMVVSKEHPQLVRECQNAFLDVLYEDRSGIVFRLR